MALVALVSDGIGEAGTVKSHEDQTWEENTMKKVPCSPEKHEEWRKKAVERHKKAIEDLARIVGRYAGPVPAGEETEKLVSLIKEALACPHCGTVIYLPPQPKYELRPPSEDISRYGKTDTAATVEGDVKIEISKDEEAASGEPVEDTDKIIDDIKRAETESKIKNSSAPAPADRAERLPVYLKSQTFPAVPVLRIIDGKAIPDPVAPYGYDENDRPIGRMTPASTAVRRNPNPPATNSSTAPPIENIPSAPQEPQAKVQGGTLADDQRLADERRAKALAAAQKLQTATSHGETPDLRETPRREMLPKPEEPIWNWYEGESWKSYCERYQIYSDALMRWQADQDVYERQAAEAAGAEHGFDQAKRKPFILLSEIFKIGSPEEVHSIIVGWLDQIAIPAGVTSEEIPAHYDNQEIQRVMIEPPADVSVRIEQRKSKIKILEQQKAELGPSRQFGAKELRKTGQQDLLIKTKDLQGRLRSTADDRRAEWRSRRKEFDEQIRLEKIELQKDEKLLKDWPKDETHWHNTIIPGTGTLVPAEVRYHPTPAITLRQLITEGSGFILIPSSEVDAYVSADRLYYGYGKTENRLIRAAIHVGIFKPDNLTEALEKYPWIAIGSVPKVEEPVEIGYEEDFNEELEYDEEKALIAKTGGTQIGGGIVGRKGDRLKSFDKRRVIDGSSAGNSSGGSDGLGGRDTGGNWSSEVNSDDYSDESGS